MRRIAVALIGALTLVVASAPPSFAGKGWLKINAAGPATNILNPGATRSTSRCTATAPSAA
jgi:hypothetical protein